ncbi:MAG: CoA pyrophosphatase [Bacteroidota bacterium]
MTFVDFVGKLEQRLQQPLPGRDAQIRMSAKFDPAMKDKYFSAPDSARLGGVLVLFYPSNGSIYLPLMKRPEYPGVHSGQVSFPGGKKEDQDDDLIQTALREAEEEVGVVQQDVKIIGALSELFIFASNFKVLPTIGYVESRPEFIPDQKEVVQIIETDLQALRNPHTIKETDIPISKGYKLRAPYFDIDGHVVWGATAMMLSELVHVINELD